MPDNPSVSYTRPWLAVILSLVIILLWECQPLRSIGPCRITSRDSLWGVAGFTVGIVTFIITNPLIRGLRLTTMRIMISVRLTQSPLPVSLFPVVTAGTTEEILCRVSPIERLAALTGRVRWGAAVVYLAFAFIHLAFWGPGGLIQVGVWAWAITGLYMWRRNLGAYVLMHRLNETFALVHVPLLFASYRGRRNGPSPTRGCRRLGLLGSRFALAPEPAR